MNKQILKNGSSPVNLQQKEGSLLKKTLLCRTGQFDGMYGPCTVTTDLLKRMAEHYNSARANPQNENDYAPILLDHFRSVENIKGRLMANLAVAPWVSPEDGQTYDGLYGDLRVDLPDAIEKVEQGIYSQVSLSFDEETGEIFEVSFVAVEAARRSQVLSQGEKAMDFEKKYKELSATHDGLVGRSKTLKAARVAKIQELSQRIEATETEAKEIIQALGKGRHALKTAILASQFKGFVKQGRMTLAEFKALKFGDLANLSKEAIAPLISSYEARSVNVDFISHGDANAKPIELGATSAEQMRELIKLQRAGKRVANLAEGDDKDKDAEDKNKSAAEGDQDKDKDKNKDGDSSMSVEDIEGAMAAFEEMSSKLEKMMESMKNMNEIRKKLQEQDEDKTDKEEGEKQ